MLIELAINLLASVILISGGYFGGVYRERRVHAGRNLEDYDFYPFGTDELNNVFFDAQKFTEAVDYLLSHRNHVAARQLILVGKQNDVENLLPADERQRYRKFHARYRGDEVSADSRGWTKTSSARTSTRRPWPASGTFGTSALRHESTGV
jgi:hypothetical protein